MDAAIHRQSLGDILHRSAAREPHKLAVLCGGVRWTYAELDDLCNRLAAGLERRGVSKGTRVAVLARNSHAFVAMRFALARLGAVLVPINFMLKPEEVAYILRHAGAALLATDSGLAPWLARRLRSTHRCASSSGCLGRPSEPEPGMTTFDALAARAAGRCRRSSCAAATSRRSSTRAAPSRARRARC
jgi:fatty-acyl-CoA synthase